MLNSDFQVSMMERDSYLGRILTGRVYSGVVRIGDRVHGLRNKDSGAEKIEDGKVCKSMSSQLHVLLFIVCTALKKYTCIIHLKKSFIEAVHSS
jgi:translation elongation factor EF-G